METCNSTCAISPVSERFKNHPCFNQNAKHSYARIHLPVAPRCNVQCRFCNRKYSCVNESRPGVTASVMTPVEALKYLDQAMTRIPNISVVGIAGPGDPFANPDETLETFDRIRQKYPLIMLCVSTNGLNILPYVDILKGLNVSHVTLTVNAVDPHIGSDIYDWMFWDNKIRNGYDAAKYLLYNQTETLKALVELDILVKVNTVYIPGVNNYHIGEISKTVAGIGASLHNIIPLIPTEDTPFSSIPEPSTNEINSIRNITQQYLPQMKHCSRCRADAAGLLGEDVNFNEGQALRFAAKGAIENLERASGDSRNKTDRPYVAVATREGIFVNMHLGESPSLHIYSPGKKRHLLIDVRKTPQEVSNCTNARWEALAELLKDCSILLVSGIGPVPKSILTASGITVRIVEDYIQDLLLLVCADEKGIQEIPFNCQKTI